MTHLNLTPEAKLQEYKCLVQALESPVEIIQDQINWTHQARLLHAILGISGEAGELVDAIKKTLAYGKELDLINLQEELGDVLFYIQLACNVLGIQLVDIMESNMAKLKVRYGNRYSPDAALNRDLNAEREALTGSISGEPDSTAK